MREEVPIVRETPEEPEVDNNKGGTQQPQQQQQQQQQNPESVSIKATAPMWRCSRIMHMQRDLHPTVLSSLEGN